MQEMLKYLCPVCPRSAICLVHRRGEASGLWWAHDENFELFHVECASPAPPGSWHRYGEERFYFDLSARVFIPILKMGALVGKHG